MNVHIADNHEIIIQGISKILKQYKIPVVGTSNNGFETLQWLKYHTCDVLILDVSMPLCNGIDVLKKLYKENNKQKVLMLSAYDDLCIVKQSIRFGAQGYVLKTDLPIHIINGLREVQAGNTYYSESILDAIIQAQEELKKEQKLRATLSKRERGILELITDEKTNKEISQTLNVSLSTIRTYTMRMREKLDVKSNIGLVKLFLNSKK
ncbi:putative Response regulator UvrY [Tenacibaculum sp. 190524A02b]|uniref:response regulator transcription factor n=1 Tax=Tenacibaculum vairaonense TaxID=3137860 RepID=UPI0032B1187D